MSLVYRAGPFTKGRVLAIILYCDACNYRRNERSNRG